MSLVNLYLSEVICKSIEGLTLTDFLHMHTLNCRKKNNKFRELSKRMASERNVTFEWYRTITVLNNIVLIISRSHLSIAQPSSFLLNVSIHVHLRTPHLLLQLKHSVLLLEYSCF